MVVFFFRQKTAYELRISDWSSDVCSSDLQIEQRIRETLFGLKRLASKLQDRSDTRAPDEFVEVFTGVRRAREDLSFDFEREIIGRLDLLRRICRNRVRKPEPLMDLGIEFVGDGSDYRSEEHTSELQSLMRISDAVFCLKKKKINT